MENRLFQIMDEMNQADVNNKTTNIGLCNQVVRADKTKNGGHVTMGVPGEVFMDIVNEKKKPILLVIDLKEYERIKDLNVQGSDTTADAMKDGTLET